MILEATLSEQLGVPTDRLDMLGSDPHQLEKLDDLLVATLRRLPHDWRLLIIIDEHLDSGHVSVSGAHAIERMRERLTSDEEARTLALIRSANDGPDDLARFTTLAHGFLSKCPTEPDRKAILRHWLARFGPTTLAS
jgi:hypothetical protein